MRGCVLFGGTTHHYVKGVRMKKYVLKRLLKSIVSIFVVLAVVVVMVFTMIPRDKVFDKDSAVSKLSGNVRRVYKLKTLSDLGYLSFYDNTQLCEAKSDDPEACLVKGSEESKKAQEAMKKDGYTIEELTYKDQLEGQVIAFRDYSRVELILRYFKNIIDIDTPNKVDDPNKPDLERKYYFAGDHDGNWGLMCSGCEYKYQLYFNGKFPFIHQNMISLNFGKSYPTFAGIKTMDVISAEQGSLVQREQVFPTGEKMNSPIKQETCRYKATPDPLDQKRFVDNYAACDQKYSSPSMIQTSYIFGVLSLILAYAIAIPAGISMAKNKGKLNDKIGIIYINLLIAIPSLAFIFLMKYFGFKLGFPDKFPQLGFNNIKSYVMPIVILGLLSTPGLMMWLRRYMIDQSNADYVKFAKAKGLSQRDIFNNHILKNAIIPIVNGIPASIILAISGALITETVFSIPGMGKMLPDAINVANNNMIITITFILTTLSILSVLLGDILMTIVDPRISLDTKKGE